MRRLLFSTLMITVGMGLSAQPATDSLQSSIFNLQSSIFNLQSSIQLVKRNDPWLTSQNAAALTRFQGHHISLAELSLTKAKGGHINYDMSPNVLQADAAVESFFRLNQRAVVFGAMSYSNFSGDDMAGAAFISSQFTVHSSQLASLDHRPFDLVEDSLMNTGTKHLDTYRLTGGFGYSVSDGFAVGARLDYTAANYAKYKDLRHQNKLMDLQLTAGIYTTITPWLQAGAHYLYHRNTESMLFSTFGKTDRVYKTLIDYANFMGQTEQFGGDGYTDKSREMPLVNDCNGIGAQISVSPLTHLAFYNTFTYTHRRGYYGRKSPYTITYTNHTSDIYHYDGRLSYTTPHTTHYLDMTLNAENLQNDAANYREMKNDAGATYYEYYTPVKTANKLWVDGSVAYTIELNKGYGQQTTDYRPQTTDDGLQTTDHRQLMSMPMWTVQAGMNWLHRKQTAYLYPYFRRQRLTTYEPFVSLCRNIVVAKGAAVWSFMLNASFCKGHADGLADDGQPYEDLTFVTPGDKQEAPASMEAYLWREYQWLTAAQYQVGGSVKYAFIFPATNLKTYVRLSLSHRKANETTIYSEGNDRTSATIAFGCEF